MAEINEKAGHPKVTGPNLVKWRQILVCIVARDRQVIRLSPVSDVDAVIAGVDGVEPAVRVAPNAEIGLSVAVVVVLCEKVGTGDAPGERSHHYAVGTAADVPRQVIGRRRAFADHGD